MSSLTVAETKSIENVKNSENMSKIRTVGRCVRCIRWKAFKLMIDSVSDIQLPFIEIQHNKIKLTVNLENCLLSSDLKYSEIPELNDTLMVWGEVDKVSYYVSL